MIDFLIVGQGIAGTLLAFHLIQRDRSFIVIDKGSDQSSSAVSSGIINPITGRRYVKSWLIDDLLPEARAVYTALETFTGQSLIHDTSIARHMASVRDENQWISNSCRPGYESYMSPDVMVNLMDRHLRETQSFGMVKGGLRVDTEALLSSFRDLLHSRGELIDEEMDYTDLRKSGKFWEYRGIKVKFVIFAEGWKVRFNPFFRFLPFQPVKGEVLICHIPDFPEERIVKYQKFFVPLGDKLFWIGTTFDWTFDNQKSDPAKRQELIDYLRNYLEHPFDIVDYKAGIRPATKFRRPFIGGHPQLPGVYLLNGLGTKGISLAPYWSGKLIQNILDGIPLGHDMERLQSLL